MSTPVNTEKNQPELVNRDNANQPPKPFPIVGIGASAGGIEAIITLLENLSPDNGMAYIIIQHLAPDHASIFYLKYLKEKPPCLCIK